MASGREGDADRIEPPYYSDSLSDQSMYKSLMKCGLAAAVLLLCPAAHAIDTEKVDQSPIKLKIQRVLPEAQIPRPIFFEPAGDGTGRIFIGSQYGEIYVLESTQDDEEPKLFLDIKDRVIYKDSQNEEGLLGFAPHPKFKENGEFFIYYSTEAEPQMSVISRFRVSKDDPNKADPASEEVLMKIKQPYWNHNGGTLAFGPDGYLYIGLGDGGMRADPLLAGQDLTTVLGKLLRIDVDRKEPGLNYAIPADNPFVNIEGARPEIFAYGFRNIWRFSFDPANGDLWAADVGQDKWEEINLVERGGNYGWSVREGMHEFHGEKGNLNAISPMAEPIWEYPHEDTIGKSITGGVVYRGEAIPSLQGYYLYGDYVSGRLWALKLDPQSGKVTENRPIEWSSNPPMVTFGYDADGEVYFTSTIGDGAIYKFVAAE